MQIGVVPSPQDWEHWTEAEAMLRPAADQGGFDRVLEDDELLWAVLDGSDLLACATTWLSCDGFVEVKLVGGREYRRWLAELDQRIGAAALEAGASRLIAFGRTGWRKTLARQGWDAITMNDGTTAYCRHLGA